MATFNQMTTNRFRKARGERLGKQIDALSTLLGRKIDVLDVGGRPDYWDNVDTKNIRKITILNYDEGELNRELPQSGTNVEFVSMLGDARNLEGWTDGSVDLVHSNSVIEHVGSWPDMAAMAKETRRVGLSGWVQTPAWEFPIEPHFRAPFLHWFAQPLRRKLMVLSPHYRRATLSERRMHVDRINLLSYGEVKALFQDAQIYIERLIFAKSYVAYWMPKKSQTGSMR